MFYLKAHNPLEGDIVTNFKVGSAESVFQLRVYGPVCVCVLCTYLDCVRGRGFLWGRNIRDAGFLLLQLQYKFRGLLPSPSSFSFRFFQLTNKG